MLTPQLSVNQWVQLPSDIRRKIVALFHVKRSGGAEVANGILLSDGHTFKDLAVITVEALQETLTDKSTNFFELFDKLLVMLENEKQELVKESEAKKEAAIEAKAIEFQEKAIETLATVTELVQATKPRGRPKKTA